MVFSGSNREWESERQTVRPLFLGPFDLYFLGGGRLPGGSAASIAEKAAARVAAEAAAKAAAKAAFEKEVAQVVAKAATTVGNQSILVTTRDVAEQAAKDWVGQGAKPIVETSTGAQVGFKSADGLKRARFTGVNKASPYTCTYVSKEISL